MPAGASLLWRVAAQTITQTAGTITAAGSFDVEGNTFVHQGGIVVGRIQLASSNVRGRLDASGPGTAAYFTTGAVDLIADINADATIVAGTSSEGVSVYVNGNLTNYGTIQLGEVNSPYGAQLADDQNANSLDNRGTLTRGDRRRSRAQRQADQPRRVQRQRQHDRRHDPQRRGRAARHQRGRDGDDHHRGAHLVGRLRAEQRDDDAHRRQPREPAQPGARSTSRAAA